MTIIIMPPPEDHLDLIYYCIRVVEAECHWLLLYIFIYIISIEKNELESGKV